MYSIMVVPLMVNGLLGHCTLTPNLDRRQLHISNCYCNNITNGTHKMRLILTSNCGAALIDNQYLDIGSCDCIYLLKKNFKSHILLFV